MWKRVCPNFHGICNDGHPDDSELFCSFWDSLNEECVIVKSMQSNVDYQKTLNNLFFKKLMEEEGSGFKIKAAEKPEDGS